MSTTRRASEPYKKQLAEAADGLDEAVARLHSTSWVLEQARGPQGPLTARFPEVAKILSMLQSQGKLLAGAAEKLNEMVGQLQPVGSAGPAGTYKIRGVSFTVDSTGHLDSCDDWETLSGLPTPREPHRGINVDLFKPSREPGGGYTATPEFWRLIKIHHHMASDRGMGRRVAARHRLKQGAVALGLVSDAADWVGEANEKLHDAVQALENQSMGFEAAADVISEVAKVVTILRAQSRVLGDAERDLNRAVTQQQKLRGYGDDEDDEDDEDEGKRAAGPSPLEQEWLDFYRTPASVIFSRTPANWDVLNRLVQKKRIVPTGRMDAGGHQLFQTAPTNTKMDPKTKNRIAASFKSVGLDGNKSFEKPDRGFVAAVDTLVNFDIEIDDIASAHLFNQPSGRMTLNLAWSNRTDPFSPVQIPDSMLVLGWYQRAPEKYEVTAYLS